MKEQIKELRLKIDGLSQLVKELKPFRDSFTRVFIESKYHYLLITDKGNFRTSEDDIYEVDELSKTYRIDLNSVEINKCYDNLMLSKAWLGKVLEQIGEESPYKNDGNRKDVKDIEETADILIHKGNLLPENERKEKFKGWANMNHIEKVDWLREDIKELIEIITKLDLKGSRELAIARTNSYNHLSEARFWLGFELGRIRDNK